MGTGAWLPFRRHRVPSFPRAFLRVSSSNPLPSSHLGSVLDSQLRTSLPSTAANHPFTPFPPPDGEQATNPSPSQGHRHRTNQPVIVRRCDAFACWAPRQCPAQHRRLQVSTGPATNPCPSVGSRGLRAAPGPSSRARSDIQGELGQVPFLLAAPSVDILWCDDPAPTPRRRLGHRI
jgi:hypothetical protein